MKAFVVKESLSKSFYKLRKNGKRLIPFVVSLSNHEWNQSVRFCRVGSAFLPTIILILMATGLSTPASAMMEHDHMLMDEKGMIMNANTDRLPKD